MKRDINKAVTAIVFAAVFGGCHNVRETVEEAAVHADVSYELKEPEKEIISTTNDFSFRLLQSLTANNKDKDFILSPLGVVYSLEIIGNGADGKTRQKLQQYLGTGKYDQADINALRRRIMLCHAKVSLDEFLGVKTTFMKSSNLLLYREGKTIKQDYVQTIGHDFFSDCLSYQHEDDAKGIVDIKYLLSEMGLTDGFSNKADFSLMSDSPLYINKMKQNIEIDVDEKGTHVEAITSTSFATLSELSKPTRAEFYANRPFIYFIRDSFGSICFAGVYSGGK